LILNMRKGDVITKEGTEEREVYVILDGSFDVHRGNKSSKEHLAVLEKGDIFGEIAFFSVSGRRSADVEALTDGEVLVLKHSFLKDLTIYDPEASWQILFYLGRVLSERVIETSNELVSILRKQSILADMNSSHTETQASADKRKQLARRATLR
jgi:CRP/FNR family cyclic AMP-dependent transcriptional regulator